MIYSGAGAWKAYSNQSGYLGSMTMTATGTTTQAFTKTGTDNGTTSVQIALRGWRDITGGAEATANTVFQTGDTITMNLTKTAYAQLDNGVKIKLYEGADNTIVNNLNNPTAALKINWNNNNSDYYDSIKSGTYSLNVIDNSIDVISSENLDLISIDMPNQINPSLLGINISSISNKSPQDALLAYKNAQQIIDNKMKRLNGDIELLSGVIQFNQYNSDILKDHNDFINNEMEARNKLNFVKQSLNDQFDYLKFYTIKSDIVSELFQYLNKEIV